MALPSQEASKELSRELSTSWEGPSTAPSIRLLSTVGHCWGLRLWGGGGAGPDKPLNSAITSLSKNMASFDVLEKTCLRPNLDFFIGHLQESL